MIQSGSLVFEKLGAGKDVDHSKMPNLDQLRKVVAGKHLGLILDELEMGITMMNNDHIRAQNLGFLEMLSEEAHRSDTASITMLASVDDLNREPGATLKRVPKIDVKFTGKRRQAKDRSSSLLVLIIYRSINPKRSQQFRAMLMNGNGIQFLSMSAIFNAL